MRVFQNSGVYPAYRPRLRRLAPARAKYVDQLAAFFKDRYGACHILAPVYDGREPVIYTNGDDPILQRAWAHEHGMSRSASLEDILLAQIEDHGTEIFYNQHPMRFGNAFLARLPGSVRMTIVWRAAPSARGEFDKHDLFICNFPSILKTYEAAGLKTAYFAPSHDPAMDDYAKRTDRPVDVLFVGGYSRHHGHRAQILELVAELASRYRVEFCLDLSRLVRLAETPVGWFGPLASHRRPDVVQRVSHSPVFGRALYERLSHAKIVLNAAVDMAGADRGNMRCWEALGCGALLLSDAGGYPEGMVANDTLCTYDNKMHARDTIIDLLTDTDTSARIARSGYQMVRDRYSKNMQWMAFQKLVADHC